MKCVFKVYWNLSARLKQTRLPVQHYCPYHSVTRGAARADTSLSSVKVTPCEVFVLSSRVRSVPRFSRRTIHETTKSRIAQHKKGLLVVGLLVPISGALFIWYQVLALHTRLKITDDVFETERQSPFIYLRKKDKQPYREIHVGKRKRFKRNLKVLVQENLGKVEPWLESRTDDPWVLLKLAQSRKRNVQMTGLQALCEDHGWDDFQYRYVAQSCDERTMVNLARMPEADIRFFRGMPKLPPPKNSIEDEFRQLLASFPVEGVDRCLRHFTMQALKKGTAEQEKTGLWFFESSELESGKTMVNPRSPELAEMLCLQALVKHSMVSAHCKHLVDQGGLQLLQRVYQKRQMSYEGCRLIAWILGNVTLQQDLHKAVIDGGWVQALHAWMLAKDTALSQHAARALANLDKDCSEPAVYQDGVYLAHPFFKSLGPVEADIVLIHGLMGGPFKTWRQQDRRKAGDKAAAQDREYLKNHTCCWPKDWLTKDCPNVRVVNVGYDTELSQWNAVCPYDMEKRSLEQRSLSLLDKLHAAGVGRRPVIWMGHSMGGLLIKEILRLASEDKQYRALADGTIGVLFYSTPHKGSTLAKYSTQASYILQPSIEVQELNKENQMLESLHEKFVQFLKEKELSCLSFGESEKTLIGMKLKTIIVPADSSDPGIGEFHLIPADHVDICKPWDSHSELYETTKEFILHCMKQTETRLKKLKRAQKS